MAVVRWAEHARDDLQEIFDSSHETLREPPKLSSSGSFERPKGFRGSLKAVVRSPSFLTLATARSSLVATASSTELTSTRWIATVVHGSRLLTEIP